MSGVEQMRTPSAVRAVIVLAGLGLALVPSPLNVVWVVLTVLAAVATALRPDLVGAIAPTVTFVIGWLVAGGWDASPDPVRTVLAAALLYVLHQATALAAVLPLGAVVAPGVLRRWARRSVPAVAIAVVVIVVDLLVSRRAGSPLIEAAALVAVLAVLALPLRTVLRPDDSPPRSGDRTS